MLSVRFIGSSDTQGEVGIYDKLSETWRPLCDDGWNLKSATVVCRQLNLGPPISIYSHASTVVSNHFGIAESDEYGIESLICDGTESNIIECQYTNSSTYGCHEKETAGVVCSPSKGIAIRSYHELISINIILNCYYAIANL